MRCCDGGFFRSTLVPPAPLLFPHSSPPHQYQRSAAPSLFTLISCRNFAVCLTLTLSPVGPFHSSTRRLYSSSPYISPNPPFIFTFSDLVIWYSSRHQVAFHTTFCQQYFVLRPLLTTPSPSISTNTFTNLPVAALCLQLLPNQYSLITTKQTSTTSKVTAD